jgi:Zn-dependent protease with chaperone function
MRALGAVLLALLPVCAQAVALTPTELTWLETALPVLSFGRAQGLPLDILIRPQAEPGDTPLGMAWVEGRCKIVLSMRGNPEAQATLDRIEPALRGPVVEAIAAHELGHCWRHVQQTWGTLPAGHAPPPGLARLPPEKAALLVEMWTTRREEAYADLVGLAWTLRHNASVYPAVHSWLVKLRQEQAVETGPHDTRTWVALARDVGRFSAEGLIFEQIEGLWITGLSPGP